MGLPDTVEQPNERLICYSRPVCHLCDVAKPILSRVAAEFGLEVEFRNVEDDPAWEARLGSQVPVAFLGTTKLFKYRASEAELRRRIGRLIGR